MTPQHYQAELKVLYAFGFWIAYAPLDEMRKVQEHAETVGPIVDPTLYRERMDALADDAALTRIFKETQECIRRDMLATQEPHIQGRIPLLSVKMTQLLIEALTRRGSIPAIDNEPDNERVP